jgi:divalent metal cation (Fe/Co/Zn/Cd) transporter
MVIDKKHSGKGMVGNCATEQTKEILPRKELIRKGRWLSFLTVSWNAFEGGAASIAGLMAGSIALKGFGGDSAIEVLSGLIMIWRMCSDADEEKRERVEAISLRLVGWSLLLLSVYVGCDAIASLLKHEEPRVSIFGIVVALLALVVMPWLAHQKRTVAAQIGSASLATDAKQTDFCFYLSAILLLGLTCNAVFALWWADPVAALIMVPIIGKEGFEALRGKTCCGGCH